MKTEDIDDRGSGLKQLVMYVCDIPDKQVRPRLGEPLTFRAAAIFVASTLLARREVSVFHRN